MTKHEHGNRFDELFRRVEMTCKCRYNASTRLQWQHTLSQWTIAYVSVALAVIPLLRMSGIRINFGQTHFEVMQIIFAIAVLVYSLLIGTENFSRRSEKLHRCGLELGRLARKIKPYKGYEGEQYDEKYKDYASQYYDILEKCENHTSVDFLLAKLSLRETYYPGCLKFSFIMVWAHFRKAIPFIPHFSVVLVIGIWVLVMIK